MAHKYNYFDALAEMAELSCQAATCFNRIVKDYNPAELSEYVQEMHVIEHAADAKRYEIMTNLGKEFLAPIERADIIDLTAKLDDITDSVDDVMQHLYIYDIKKLLPECQEFSDLVKKCCEAVYEVAKEFRNFHKSTTITDKIAAVHVLESQGDQLYSQAMRGLQDTKVSDKTFLIWTRLIASFEDCCDNCEDAAELFESAVMKNS
jgi:predicted phosphate transport protein (TIGR00153 family)